MAKKDLLPVLIILNKLVKKEKFLSKEMLNFSKESKHLVSNFCYFNSRLLYIWLI